MNSLACTVFVIYLILLAVSDHRFNLLPDKFTLSLLWLGLVVNSGSLLVSPSSAITGAASAYISVRILHDIQAYARGFSGIGLGDAKYLAAIGAWFGWQCLPIVLVIASVFTIFVYGFTKNTKMNEIPFGVGLSVAAGVVVLDTLIYSSILPILPTE